MKPMDRFTALVVRDSEGHCGYLRRLYEQEASFIKILDNIFIPKHCENEESILAKISLSHKYKQYNIIFFVFCTFSSKIFNLKCKRQ